MSDPNYVVYYTNEYLKKYLENTTKFMADIRNHTSENMMKNYIDGKVDELVEDITALSPFAWQDF